LFRRSLNIWLAQRKGAVHGATTRPDHDSLVSWWSSEIGGPESPGRGLRPNDKRARKGRIILVTASAAQLARDVAVTAGLQYDPATPHRFEFDGLRPIGPIVYRNRRQD